MSDSDDELNFPMYGNLLPPFEEDEIPTKKPLNIEDQVATDAHGRRRFHGAFTGGFSAGFCNTVGSLEGWQPKNFKSSRSEKAGSHTQRPEDFMDDEDRAIFGFAPETTITTKDYNSANTRKRQRFVDTGPIPGQCVLKLLLEPAKETIGVKLLKQMGWRPGQGVGPRLTSKQKKKLQKKKGLDVSDDDSDGEEITFAPDDFDQYVCRPKVNTFGMGYIGLSMDSILGAKNKSEHFTMVDHKNKKISIKGQAFGVGAFEEDDEDIYAKEDMTSYDFELGATKSAKALMHQNNILDNFVKSSKPISVLKYFPPPVLPKDYVFEHRVRRTRFEPLSQNKKQELKKFDRKLDAEKRSALINEDPKPETPEVKTIPGAPRIIQHPLMVNKFVSSSSGSFKPFAIDPEKQERYDKYVELAKKGELDKYEMPITLNEWERSREMFEFEQAYQMFQPKHGGMVFDRFVEAEQHEDVNNLVEVQASDIQNAAKMKMFGKLTRDETPWHPHSLLYKRFNIAEPLDTTPSATVQKKKTFKTSNIFDFINASAQNQPTKPVPANNAASDTPKVVPIKIPVSTSPKPPETIQSPPIENTPTPTTEISLPKPMNISPSTSKTSSVVPEPEPSTSTPRKVIPEIQEGDVLHTENKIDLYKAIFLSSDEEEDSEPEEESEKETFKDLLINEIQPKKSATEMHQSATDILAPVAEPKGIFAKAPVVKPTGIFANVDLSALNQKPIHKFTPRGKRDASNGDSDLKDPENEKIVDTFGPKPKLTPRVEVEIEGSSFGPKLGSIVKDSGSALNDGQISVEDAYGPKLPSVIPNSSKSIVVSSDSSSSEDQWVEKKVKKHKKKSKHKKKKEHRKHKKSKRSKEK